MPGKSGNDSLKKAAQNRIKRVTPNKIRSKNSSGVKDVRSYDERQMDRNKQANPGLFPDWAKASMSTSGDVINIPPDVVANRNWDQALNVPPTVPLDPNPIIPSDLSLVQRMNKVRNPGLFPKG